MFLPERHNDRRPKKNCLQHLITYEIRSNMTYEIDGTKFEIQRTTLFEIQHIAT